jgi:hypothetical protein
MASIGLLQLAKETIGLYRTIVGILRCARPRCD